MFGGQIVAAYPQNIVGCFSAALHGQDAKKYLMNKKGSLWISISASKICGYIYIYLRWSAHHKPFSFFMRSARPFFASSTHFVPMKHVKPSVVLGMAAQCSRWNFQNDSRQPGRCEQRHNDAKDSSGPPQTGTRRNFGRWWRFEFYDKARLTCAMHHSWTESKRNIDRVIGFWVPQCGSGILQIIIWCQSDQTKGKNEQ